ncbi:beta-lactamase family protein [Streptomyces sp. NBC_00536]|uniref:serine hydrolase domain-containing protein n=1 Tax=Streptomyces sp. NBC_00536 TaxID=2975769 RepID=UPI002E81F6ED|nr:serine hydrolase domain-containing protein [Streptomyces sp. NBC_00536]WUC81567.1 beta-lactamase family protein [Streptomyces sp. NBC_00536]
MNARTRTLIAATLVLGIASGPVAAHAAPAPASPSSSSSPSAATGATPPMVPTAPNAAALAEAIAGVGAGNKDATAALVRVGGTSGSWQGSSGVADIRSGRAAIEEGRFRVGSVTKTFTAAVVLQLAAEGKVSLDQSVQHYLPGLLPDTFQPVTVRQLLNYTSGIQSADGPGDTFDAAYAHRFDIWDPHAMIANAVAKGPDFAPGTKQEYLNIDYTILGVLIEKLTGTSYAKAVEARVIRPLGLRDTSFPGPVRVRIQGPHNHGYQAVTGTGGSRELVDVSDWNASEQFAAGDLISTTADLERFTVALFSGRLVPKAQLEEMFTVPEVKNVEGGDADLTAGMKRFVLPGGVVAWGKTGGRPGYNTAIGATRDLSRTLVYSVNSTDAKGLDMNPIAFKLVMAAFKK